MVQIAYVGFKPVVRQVDPYTWNEANVYLQDVEAAELVVDLLSNPGPDFEVAATEPLLDLEHITPANCANLAAAGILSIGHLATSADAKVAEALGISKTAAGALIRAAQVMAAPKE